MTIHLEVSPADKSRKRLVIASHDGAEHRDRFDTDSAFLRQKFCEALSEKFGSNGADLDDIDDRLIKLADAEDSRVDSDPNVPDIRISASPREMDRARIEFSPIPASQLGDGEQVDWIWHGYVARGFVTLLVGLWKAGKSTLLSYLLKAMQDGGDLAGHVIAGKVLVITEEGSGLWARRRDDVGFGDHCHFDIRPFKGRPTPSEWLLYIESVAAAVERGEYDLVIIDTWASVNPCPDENDASGMMAALSPLHSVVEAGAAVLLAHHPCKGDATEGQASRGSGALPGFVDTIIELRRFNAQEADDRRRKLRGYGRFEETVTEVVIELRDDGYHSVGSTGDANRCDRQEVIGDILAGDAWLTSEEVRDRWTEGTVPKPGKRTLQIDLNRGYDAGQWQREGKGAKGDPFRYKFDSRTPPVPRERANPNGECDHQSSESWTHRDGKAFCQGCDKYMGRLTHDD